MTDTPPTTTPDTIKADVDALQQATASAVALIEQLSSGYQVSQDEMDNLHTALVDATQQLNAAVAAATPSR